MLQVAHLTTRKNREGKKHQISTFFVSAVVFAQMVLLALDYPKLGAP